MREIKYIVRKRFKYAGRIYIPGEEWEPDGSKFDEIIIEQARLVKTVNGEPKDKTRLKRERRVQPDAAT